MERVAAVLWGQIVPVIADGDILSHEWRSCRMHQRVTRVTVVLGFTRAKGAFLAENLVISHANA
jgi:hypothetical protein